MPLISVIVPVYNAGKYLEECVNSIRNQSYQSFEILLVNDGSTDNSEQLCESFASKDKRIRAFSKENGGLISAWTYGLKKARGEYISFVDSDDWVDHNMLEKMALEITGNEKEVICGNYVLENLEKAKSIKIAQSLKPGSYNREEIEEKIIPQLLGKEKRSIHSSRCMKLISVRLLKENLSFTDPRVTMGEDLNIMYAVFLEADRLVVLKDSYFYHYRFVDSSMVHKYNPCLNEKINLLYEALKKVVVTKIGEESRQREVLEGLKKEYIFLLFLVLKNELRGPAKNRVRRIQEIVRKAKEKGLKDTRIQVTTNANRLLYRIWKRTDAVSIGMAALAIRIFDRR